MRKVLTYEKSSKKINKNFLFLSTLISLKSLASGFASDTINSAANSYISGQSWFCRAGYKKANNQCANIFQVSESNENQVKEENHEPTINVWEKFDISITSSMAVLVFHG